MAKIPYVDTLNPERQVDMEEAIAAKIFDTINNDDDGTVSEEMAGELGRDILYLVLREFRRDLLSINKKHGNEAKAKQTHDEFVVNLTGCEPADVPELDDLVRLTGYRIGELTVEQYRQAYEKLWEEVRTSRRL